MIKKLSEKLAAVDLESALLDATANVAAVLSDEELGKVSGGRVKTSDKMQQALLDFVKG
jgi:hypothetical protein